MAYVELQVTSNFSFLRGASHPQELVRQAAALGQRAVALTDRNSLAGVVRAHEEARQRGIRLVVGARLDLEDGASLLCYPTDRAAYGRLSRLLTLGRRRAPKGACHLSRADVAAHAEGQIALILAPEAVHLPGPAGRDAAVDFRGELEGWRTVFGAGCHLAAQRHLGGDDAARLARLAALAEAAGTPLVATNDVHMHAPERRKLLDVLTCIREHCTLAEAGLRLVANAERHLKSEAEMARLFAACPEAVTRSAAIAESCRFTLEELRYEYPDEPVPEGRTPQGELERLTWEGAAWRYPPERFPQGVPEAVKRTVARELRLIEKLNYAPYFLTVHDIVRFARERDILCQGRGSAANSAVCYCLGITAVDPEQITLLFERFISAARGEPPDIDVDFEHERREEVIQYLYARYGRDRAGLTATVISYRARSAIREVGKVMGLSGDTLSTLAGTVWGWSGEALGADHVRARGLDPEAPDLALTLSLARELIGFPRHLSQHTGGFVLTRGPLSEVVPIENAAMADRTVIQWDKDDLDTLGILKIDVLGLGMLTCLRKGFDLIARHGGRRWSLAGLPEEDDAVYDMLCAADSIGVFQVESRAQMSMLPRLKPRCFYDLVVEVAIVRPGPIQGDMVHPYLRRRDRIETVEYPSPELRKVLEKTLGVPLFQEQAMQIAIVAAGFTPDEADQLRRAMAAFRRAGTIETFRDKMVGGMVARGYDRGFAERCFSQIEGFGEYGFPESHAASFALLVYASAWMKRHHPAAFACALLNSQPMGFYAPAQIVRDAQEHGVEVRPVDVNHSDWDCTLEPAGPALPGMTPQDPLALRLGLRRANGVSEAEGRRLVAARGNGYADPLTLWRRAGLAPRTLARLTEADAFGSLGLDRRSALWAVRGLGPAPLPLFAAAGEEDRVPDPETALPSASAGEAVMQDYAALRLSLKAHPLALLRPGLAAEGYRPAAEQKALSETPKARSRRHRMAGLVLVRQRPGSSTVIFMTLEDESGIVNVVVWPQVFAQHRAAVMTGRLVGVEGVLQREGEVIHLVARRITDLTGRLATLTAPGPVSTTHFPSRDFH